jgi:hypothetical protein
MRKLIVLGTLASLLVPHAHAQTTMNSPLTWPIITSHDATIAFTAPDAVKDVPLSCADPKKIVTIRATADANGRPALSVSCEVAQ